MTRDGVFQVFGLNQSYFTRKVVGYLDHKRIAWALRRAGGMPPDMVARGFPGGIPALETPDGELLWDSTAMIGYLERRFPEPAVLPADPALLFLCYLIDDVCDEWLYRPAVGSRWFIDENARLCGGRMTVLATIDDPAVIHRILTHLGLSMDGAEVLPAARGSP